MGKEISREKAITNTSVIGIVTNIFLSLFKAGAGLIAGSIAIVLDSVNNLTDALSSAITIAGIKLAKKNPDTNHPFGYGRIEYFSAIIISIIVLAAGVTSIIESIKKIITPEKADYSIVTIIIIVASVITKLILGTFVKKQGKKYNSDALVASGSDASFDAIISGSTLLCALATMIFDFVIDGIVGTIISIFIIKAGIEMLLGAVDDVMGNRPDSEITKDIKAAIREIPGVMGAYDLVLHNYGPNSAMGSVHVEIPSDMPASDIHKLTTIIQATIIEKFKIFLTVGIYAVEVKDENIINIKKTINDYCVSNPGVINTHGYYIDVDRKIISFDLTADFTIKNKAEFIKNTIGHINEMYPEYQVEINIDTNYSD